MNGSIVLVGGLLQFKTAFQVWILFLTLVACNVLHNVWCALSTKFCWCSPAGIKVNFTPISSINALVSVAVKLLPLSTMTRLGDPIF